MLEDVPAAPMLGRHVDAALGVEPCLAVGLDPTALGAQQPGGHAQDARLACSRGAGEGEALAGLDAQLDVEG